MPVATARSVSLQGALGHLIDVQADVSPGQAGFTMVGRSKSARLVTGPDAVEAAAGRGDGAGGSGGVDGRRAGGSAILGAGRGANPRKRKKKKRKELKNFYRWQLREQKKKELEKLKVDFQADLKKIERMKQSKKLVQVVAGR